MNSKSRGKEPKTQRSRKLRRNIIVGLAKKNAAVDPMVAYGGPEPVKPSKKPSDIYDMFRGNRVGFLSFELDKEFSNTYEQTKGKDIGHIV